MTWPVIFKHLLWLGDLRHCYTCMSGLVLHCPKHFYLLCVFILLLSRSLVVALLLLLPLR